MLAPHAHAVPKRCPQDTVIHCLLQSGPKASLYLTLVGILAGFLSAFWNYGYLRVATKMQEYLDGANVAKVKKQQVGCDADMCVYAHMHACAVGAQKPWQPSIQKHA